VCASMSVACFSIRAQVAGVQLAVQLGLRSAAEGVPTCSSAPSRLRLAKLALVACTASASPSATWRRKRRLNACVSGSWKAQ
jgi:hypothetical protein